MSLKPQVSSKSKRTRVPLPPRVSSPGSGARNGDEYAEAAPQYSASAVSYGRLQGTVEGHEKRIGSLENELKDVQSSRFHEINRTISECKLANEKTNGRVNTLFYVLSGVGAIALVVLGVLLTPIITGAGSG